MVLAIVLFVAGSKSYTHVPPTERYGCIDVGSAQALYERGLLPQGS